MKKIKKFIIYGAGRNGQGYYEYFCQKGLEDHIWGFCDENAEHIGIVGNKNVYSYDEVKEKGIPFLISITTRHIADKIEQQLEQDGNTYYTMDELAGFIGEDKVTFNREFVSFFHLSDMDQYFDSAEKESAMEVFWGKESFFFSMFKKLDLTHIVELACGRGRHVPKYYTFAETVTLVDILEKNIEICKKRFKNQSNIEYYCNNGFNLEQLQSEKYTSVFCYDAMVHFELMDIYEYLKDIYRVLVPGGRALLHHSNNDSDYRASFGNATYGRSFMNKKVFAYLSHRVGFKIIEQREIDWEVKGLDCITFLEK